MLRQLPPTEFLSSVSGRLHASTLRQVSTWAACYGWCHSLIKHIKLVGIVFLFRCILRVVAMYIQLLGARHWQCPFYAKSLGWIVIKSVKLPENVSPSFNSSQTWGTVFPSIGSTSCYHDCGGAVFVALIEVTLSVMGVDQACQPAVQGQVRNVVRGKHQQVVGFFPPANLVLLTGNRRLDYSYFLKVLKENFELNTQMHIGFQLVHSRMR